MPNKIHKLPPLLIAKIAAGEVIERPSFAVKELIENAIDAKAEDIKIYIEEAGLKKIQVIDNGEGMSQEDVLESWKSHTTSKITDEGQLYAIESLGFRGEALSSLVAASLLTIQSRTVEDLSGFSVNVKEGIVQSAKPIGMPVGTVIIAEHLFSSLPARKKFLKSPQLELRHIIDVVNHFAVSYPSIHFTLLHGTRTLLDYPKTNDMSIRIEQMVGEDVYSQFIPFKKNESYLSINGFIAKPQINSSSQNKQFLFVNKRKIGNKLISAAVKESYGNMLESNRYPLFVLFLTLPYEMVDVNMHPRKEQVAFLKSQFIFQTIKQAIADVLAENNLTFQNLSWKKTGVGMTHSFAGKLLKETILDKENLVAQKKADVLQLHKVYIAIGTQSGLLLLDQHAAHERILYEKLKSEFITQKESHVSFKLPASVDLHLTESQNVILEEYKDMLKHLGFDFKNQTLTHIPLLFQDRNPKELLMALIEEETETGFASVDRISEEMLSFLSCRAAVKAGDTLTDRQMRKIQSDLEETPNNSTCPHGRPTKIYVSMDELNGLFKRK